MSLHFYAYARKGYEFIDDVADSLNSSDTDRVGRLTRCVFRALRNQLSIDDSFTVISQLPMALKGVYVDGWKIATAIEGKNAADDFISEVVREEANSAWRDFSNEQEVRAVIIAVLKVLSKQFGETEAGHIIKNLPVMLKREL